MSPKTGHTTLPPSVVGIGASAGGIEAIQAFFGALPSDLGHAYVVVVHLAPDHPSELGRIIERKTKMNVTEMRDELVRPLEPNHVYVIAPDRKIELAGATVRASSFEAERGKRAAIDTFFSSVASSLGDLRGQAYAVVLSGEGSDGVLGAKAIKEAGGIILVQDPDEAQHRHMPESVLTAGLADFVLPVQQLAGNLRAITEHDSDLPLAPETKADGSPGQDDGVLNILNLLKSHTGHDFTQYKRASVLRRLKRRMQITRSTSLEEYFSLLEANDDEPENLRQELLISVTMFFRDPEVWKILRKSVVEPLVKRQLRDETLRVWVPGCATGEEAYSLAILFHEELSRQDKRNELIVFATDVDEQALAVAREGRYPAGIVAEVSDKRRKRYFQPETAGFRVSAVLRDIVVFATHNLLRDPPFSGLHLVACRNVMIYFGRELQQKVEKIFRYAIRDDGFLFLGTSESAGEDLFIPVSKSHRIYKARKPLSERNRLTADFGTAPTPSGLPLSAPRFPGTQSAAELHLELLERHAPPSVLIDQDLNVIHMSETAGRFLEHRGGRYPRAIVDLVLPQLREELRAALENVAAKNTSCMSVFVEVRLDGENRDVGLILQPQLDRDGKNDLILIFFLDGGSTRSGQARDEGGDSDAMQLLREKLERSEVRIRRISDEKEDTEQELRAANEELQSINEEYRSTTEELETSKEELQSVNEELQTVNAELTLKLEEVSQAHNDLENLIASTNIASLFVDRDLRIKRFTPRLAELFSVQKMDEGRPISDFTHKLAYDTLEVDALAVLKELSPIERELETHNGHTVLVRMRPYRTSDDRIDGVAITFLDVTTLKRTQQALHASEKNLLSELEVTRRLHQMTMSMATADSTTTALNEILSAAIELHGSQFGSIHMLDNGDARIRLAGQARFPESYLERLEFLSCHNDFVFQQVLETKKVLSVDNLNANAEAPGNSVFGADELFSAILLAPLFGDDGSVLGILSVYFREPRKFAVRDIQLAELMSRHAASLLVRRRHQDQLQSLIETLRQRSQALEKSEALLSEQALELRTQDKAKEDFISMLGHELRNPLAAVLNCLDFLALNGAMESSQSSGTGDASLRQSLEIINRQSRHMQKLIDDLLDISRVSRGKLRLRLEAVDICGSVRDVAEAIRPRFDSRRVGLTLELPANPVFVTADPERVMQILDNLLRNASSYTDQGGKATVHVETEDQFARISVRDSGIGLEPEKIASLFEPYRQLENSSRDGGLGLGLTLVKQLVDLHGGTVSARSEGRGHGSEFIVCLPLSESHDELPEPRPAAETKPEHGHRVLVVDDKSDNADALAAILANLKQTVQTAYSGEEALKIAATFKPDIVFLDISMPEMSGYEVARRLRNRDQGEAPLLVALTGHPHMLEPKLFDHHLLKPIMIPTVVDLLNRVDSPD